MPKGGRLTIDTANVKLDRKITDGNLSVEPGDYVVITVSDNGSGMDAELRAHVFEPFFTTKGLGKGTGLGLSIVYGIVNQSGGHIAVDSEPGRGTTFRIYLPRLKEEERRVESKAPPIASRPSPAASLAETILVVEDEPMLADVTRSILETSGYNILVANGPDEAINLAKTYPGEIHLLLSDVILRDQLDGVQLAEQIKQVRPRVKVLFMSGYNDVLAGVSFDLDNQLLEKPFDSDQLRTKVRKTLLKDLE
jgi:CheY-like chemotaxis protein